MQNISVNGQPAQQMHMPPQPPHQQQSQPPVHQMPQHGAPQVQGQNQNQFNMPTGGPGPSAQQGQYQSMSGYAAPGFGQPSRPAMGGPGSMQGQPPHLAQSPATGFGANVRPPQPGSTPGIPGIPTLGGQGMTLPHHPQVQIPWGPGDYPFDPRILSMVQHLGDPDWVNQRRQDNPGMLQAAEQARMMIQSGKVKPDVIARMHAAATEFGRRSEQAWESVRAQQAQAAQLAQQQAQQAQAQGQSQQQQAQTPRTAQTRNAPGRPKSSGRQPSGSNANGNKKDQDAANGRAANQPGTPAQSQGQGYAPPSAVAGPSSQPPERPLPPAPPVPTLPEWPPDKAPHPALSNVLPLPFNDFDESVDPTFGGALPEMTKSDIANVQEWIEKDKRFLHHGIDVMRSEMKSRTSKWGVENDRSTPWWSLRRGEKPTVSRQKLKILWPHDRQAQKAKSKRKEVRL
jgi:hypothetical protein